MAAMDPESLRALIADIRSGAVAPDDAMRRLRVLPFADLGDSMVDHHRTLRQGVPEAVYAPGKSIEQIEQIVAEMLDAGSGPVLVTRLDATQTARLTEVFPGAHVGARCALWRRPEITDNARALIATAGTADSPVADEAAFTLDAYGIAHDRLNDIGVSGLHRVLAHLDQIIDADAIITIAGMEGALASVIGGLTDCPVIAVPTSVGYGAGLDGVTALLAMHASCASGITVVGIDNGFGAATAIARIFRR